MTLCNNRKIGFLIALVSILSFSIILSCPGKKPAIPPEVINAPKEKQGPGDVWIVPEIITVAAGDEFTNDIHVNSGDQLVAAYGIIVYYDSKILRVNANIGNNSTTEGPDGFIQAVNPNNKGQLFISGFDVTGKGGPGADLDMIKIHWKALKKGESDLFIQIKNLVDGDYRDVGNPVGFSAKVIVN